MLKKNITYTDLDSNVTRTEDFYFNLTKAEAIELNLIEDLESVSKSVDPKAIIPVFKRIVRYSYGIRSREGKFMKEVDGESVANGFLASDAYSELFLDLLKDGEQGVVNFINGVLGFNVEELRTHEAQTGTQRNPQPEGQPAEPISIPVVPQQSHRGPVNWTGDSYPTEAKPELGDTWNGRSLQRPTPELQDPQPESNHTPPQPGEQLGGTPIIPSDTAIYDSVRQQGIPGLPELQ